MLTDEQKESWRQFGWLHLPDVLPPEFLAQLEAWITDISGWADGGPGLHHREQTDHGPALARSERFADDHSELDEFIRAGRPAELVADLLGEPAVLFKEKINYKHSGGAGFAPHQDATAYRFVDHHVSVLVPVDPATLESGCLWLAPGHGEGHLATDGRGRIAEEVAAGLDWRPIEIAAGDMVAFDSFAPHYSDTNTTSRSRRALYLTYNAASKGDQRARYYADKEAEFAREGETFIGERVRMSINDDFLGRPVEE